MSIGPEVKGLKLPMSPGENVWTQIGLVFALPLLSLILLVSEFPFSPLPLPASSSLVRLLQRAVANLTLGSLLEVAVLVWSILSFKVVVAFE